MICVDGIFLSRGSFGQKNIGTIVCGHKAKNIQTYYLINTCWLTFGAYVLTPNYLAAK